MDRLFDRDILSGITRTFHYDDSDDSFVIKTVQDCDAVVGDNKALHADQDEKTGWKGTWHRVASIPNIVWWDLVKKGIADDEKALKKWLNDPDNRFFRVRPGKV